MDAMTKKYMSNKVEKYEVLESKKNKLLRTAKEIENLKFIHFNNNSINSSDSKRLFKNLKSGSTVAIMEEVEEIEKEMDLI